MADVDTSALKAVLPGIADSSVKSPFEFANQQAQAQKNALDVQKLQAEKAAGQAYQGAVNPQTGEFDPNEFRRRLAASGPAAMAAGAAMLNTQQISSDQLKQNLEKAKWVNSASGAALQSGDFSDAAMLRLFQSGIANGTLTMAEVQKHMQTIPADAAGRKQWLTEHQMTGASVQQQLEQRQGTQQTITTPGATYTVNVPPISANQTVVVPHGTAPGDMVEVKEWVKDGKVVPSGTPGASEQTRTVPKSQAPGVPQAGPPQLVPGTGGGTGTGGGGSTTTAPVPIPTPPGVNVIPPGYQPRPGTTPPVTPNAPVAAPASPFGTGAFGGGSSTASQAPAPAAPAVTPPAATPTPPGLVTSTTVPATAAVEQKASQEQFIADRTALPQRQTQEQNLMHAYDALELVTSGKGTETAAKWRNFLATVGALPPGQVDDVAIYEVGRKYLEKTISDIGNAGGTDTARALAGASNPSVALTNPANLAVLRNDIGKIRQQMAANMTAPDQTTGAGYGKHAGDHASNTDYRGFAWDKYSDGEKAQILKSVGAEDSPAYKALARAIAMQKAFWPKKGAGPIVPHAEATPTAAPANALAMAPAQSGNPLLAA